jgi:sarcosine oxidase subunit alpha
MSETLAGARLPRQAGEVIDRSRRIAFTFNGQLYAAHPGDTIASALAASGVRVLSRSFKYHRPRGLLCGAGHCPNCLVQINDEPNVRACQRLVEEGMAVQAQNAWPSLERDLLSLSELGARFMPVGFYYKTFMRPARLWPLYEGVLRRAAGLGRVDPHSPEGAFDQQYLHGQVVVVGAGPAGLSAALAAAQAGARVLLFDENAGLGGHLRFAGEQGAQTLAPLLAQLGKCPQIEVFADAAVVGWYQDNWLAAVQERRLFKIRAQALVVASGAYEAPLVFDDNDRPGVMLGSAVQRLLHLYGIAPGKRAVVATANEDGWEVAADLCRAGVEVAGVVDERAASASPRAKELAASGIPLFFQHTILAAHGGRTLSGATIGPLIAPGQTALATAQTLECDLIALSVGWTPAADLLYMAGGRSAYDQGRAEMRLEGLPQGVFAAGRVNGAHALELELCEGRLVGRQAAAFAGKGRGGEAKEVAELEERKAAQRPRTSARLCVPGKRKRFVCFCEDVADQDVYTAMAEGYESLELLKRYSTLSMGPCQGKMCSMNAIHLCARFRGQSVQETGRTTARPPIVPVRLGVLAGQRMEPVQVSPVHLWHQQRGAKMLVAGLWLRPEHYGDPVAEVEAVRQRVGLIDVSPLGKLKLTGSGVADLLERLYVNQWRTLRVGRVRYGVMCNDEGVVLDDGVCGRVREEEWYLSTTSAGSANIYEWIQWWVQSGWGEGVHVVDLTEAHAAFNLAGPRSRQVLQKLTERDLSNEAFPYMCLRSAQVAGVPCRLLRIGFTGELSYEIHAPASSGLYLWEALMEAGEEFGIAPFGVEAQRILRLEKGHLIVGQDTDALADALSAGLEGLVKLEKADFLGKRALARIAATGPRQRLAGFEMVRGDLAPDEGLQIVQRQASGGLEIIGWITSSRFSPTLQKGIGLCWLPAELAAQEGTSISVCMNGKLEEARVHHGAFYDPEGERLKR